MEPQVNREHYFRSKYDDLDRFISYFYQVDLVRECDANIRMHTNDTNGIRILEIGVGNGFLSDYTRKLGYNVTTCDFDKNLNPDVVADVRNLPLKDGEFDVVTAFEVLEHIPFEDVPKALSELRRVTKRYAIISLPYKSTGLEVVLKFPGVRTFFSVIGGSTSGGKKSFLDFFLRLPLKFGGIKVSGQHYWEIDGWQYRLSRVRTLLRSQFKILKEARPVLNKYHYFFVLQK